MHIAKALTIAGSDSGGGAGIQADLKTFAALGVYGSSVITAVTAQNTCQVTGIHALPSEMVAKQMEAVLTDIGADTIKTGMLANAEIIEVVADILQRYSRIPLVVDPVMVAKSGASLLTTEAVKTLREKLIPLAKIVTPNIPETEALVGKQLQNEADFIWAARAIFDMGAKVIVLKGGHRPERARTIGSQVVDLFYDGTEIPHTHGTGCTFASAIAAGLAKGLGPFQAVLKARQYLTGALEHAFPVGQGKSPVHHFHCWWPRE
jgi:hydroxymethylpyrimidine/phosphomethylpyrimidine kinase